MLHVFILPVFAIVLQIAYWFIVNIFTISLIVCTTAFEPRKVSIAVLV